MQIPTDAPRNERQIGSKGGPSFKVQVSAPFSTGHVCSEAEASILNQTLAENVSNNLRAKLVEGRPAIEANAETGQKAEAARPWTPEEAQALVDKYLAEYEPGVRTGGGTPRVTDPVEREAINLAGERVDAFLDSKGLKRKDVDFKAMRQALFDANRNALMGEAKKVVAARERASKGAEDLTADLINFLPGVSPSEAETEGEEEVEEAAE